MNTFTKSLRLLTILSLTLFILSPSTHAQAEEKPAEPAKPAAAGVDTAAVLKIISDFEAGNTKGADSSGGVGKKVTTTLTKSIYTVYAGVENKFNLTISKPTVIIQYAGRNTFNITKDPSFTGEVTCVYFYGSNQFSGCKEQTFGQYRAANQK